VPRLLYDFRAAAWSGTVLTGGLEEAALRALWTRAAWRPLDVLRPLRSPRHEQAQTAGCV
jgi:hypothetical protein